MTLVGKGVMYDTGGLDIKPGGSMGAMKKDMGGAAKVSTHPTTCREGGREAGHSVGLTVGCCLLPARDCLSGLPQVLALAYMIMAAKLPVRLRVLVPSVENSVDARSYRNGDIIKARNGLTTEIISTGTWGGGHHPPPTTYRPRWLACWPGQMNMSRRSAVVWMA